MLGGGRTKGGALYASNAVNGPGVREVMNELRNRVRAHMRSRGPRADVCVCVRVPPPISVLYPFRGIIFSDIIPANHPCFSLVSPRNGPRFSSGRAPFSPFFPAFFFLFRSAVHATTGSERERKKPGDYDTEGKVGDTTVGVIINWNRLGSERLIGAR